MVICGRKRATKEAYHDIVVSHQGRQSTTDRVKRGLQYREDQFVEKSVLRPETLSTANPKARSNDNEIYGKWSQAIASAHDLLVEAAVVERWLFTVVVPLVVLPDNTLWSAVYDADGNLESDPSLVDSCTFYVGHPSLSANDGHHQVQPATLSHIHFLTQAGFAEFLATFDSGKVDWDYWIPDDNVLGYNRR